MDGKVVEINAAVIENPSLIHEDPLGDGWLFRVEPNNTNDLDELSSLKTDSDD